MRRRLFIIAQQYKRGRRRRAHCSWSSIVEYVVVWGAYELLPVPRFPLQRMRLWPYAASWASLHTSRTSCYITHSLQSCWRTFQEMRREAALHHQPSSCGYNQVESMLHIRARCTKHVGNLATTAATENCIFGEHDGKCRPLACTWTVLASLNPRSTPSPFSRLEFSFSNTEANTAKNTESELYLRRA